MVFSIYIFSFWGFAPRPLPRLCPWTPLGDFCRIRRQSSWTSCKFCSHRRRYWTRQLSRVAVGDVYWAWRISGKISQLFSAVLSDAMLRATRNYLWSSPGHDSYAWLFLLLCALFCNASVFPLGQDCVVVFFKALVPPACLPRLWVTEWVKLNGWMLGWAFTGDDWLRVAIWRITLMLLTSNIGRCCVIGMQACSRRCVRSTSPTIRLMSSSVISRSAHGPTTLARSVSL